MTEPTIAVIEVAPAALVEVVDTEPPYAVVEVLGQQGPQGVAGASGAAHQHTQDEPGTVWTITHDLGYDPAGIVVVADGYVLEGFGVQYLDAGVSLRLSFDISVAGVAYLS